MTWPWLAAFLLVYAMIAAAVAAAVYPDILRWVLPKVQLSEARTVLMLVKALVVSALAGACWPVPVAVYAAWRLR